MASVPVSPCYFELDVSIVRALFIATTIFGGFGVAVYVALWVLVGPTDPAAPEIDGADESPEVEDVEDASTLSESGIDSGTTQKVPGPSELSELSQNPVRAGEPPT